VVSKLRLERIAERIREDLAEILHQEALDPRLDGLLITGVKVDRELAYADIHVSILEGEERSKEVLDGLKHASGYLRSSLAQRIELHTFPRLRFYWDSTAEKAARIEEIIASLHSEESQTDIPAGTTPDTPEDKDTSRIENAE
jgi:ribosome-binding factor A